MKCNFLLSACIVVFLILRLSAAPCGDPTRTTITGESPPACLKIHGCEFASSSKFSHLRRVQVPRSLLSVCLLLLAGDVEVNPGPSKWKFPCGVCSALVRSNQRGVQCDVCTFWLHARCIGISNEEYAELQNSDDLKEAVPFHDVCNSDSIFEDTADPIFNTSANES